MRRSKRAKPVPKKDPLDADSVYNNPFSWFKEVWNVPDTRENREYHEQNVGTSGLGKNPNWMLELLAIGTAEETRIAELFVLADETEIDTTPSDEWLKDQEKATAEHASLEAQD